SITTQGSSAVSEQSIAKSANGSRKVNEPHHSNRQPLIDLDIQKQIREFLAQGYRLSIEYANERRVRNNAWQTGITFPGNKASDVIMALDESLAEHQGEYVRLIGIDPKAKRRVLEKIIQRP
ncbi:MAG: ribulose 1,5-bisphosphate carboxylase, partial [Symploca sp. SIO3E6]|nr:ribulose 1,5-bisphosphate carboxylase [Caldora sp. SIO3E6]